MDIKSYKAKLDSLNLDKNKYCIISGGVMLFYRLKETTADIDICVKPDYFEGMKKKFIFKKSNKYPNLYELDPLIEVKVQDFNSKDIRMVDGYPTESLELTLKWMLEHNRPKDQEKIKIIQNYIEKH